MLSDHWRVVTETGDVRVAPTPCRRDDTTWVCRDGSFLGYGSVARHAIGDWAVRRGIDWTEIVPPGQLTKEEAIDALIEACAVIAEDDIDDESERAGREKAAWAIRANKHIVRMRLSR